MIRRNTIQRKIVYDSLSYLAHASSEQLIEYIQNNYSDISIATIYRNLSILMEENLVKKIKLKGIDVYETVKENHYHFLCKKCHMIYDISPKLVFETEIKEVDSNIVDSYDIAFYGICKNCKNKMEEN